MNTRTLIFLCLSALFFINCKEDFSTVEKTEPMADLCPKGKIIPFTKEFNDYRTDTRKKEYRARKHVCMDCPILSSCLGKSAQEKKFSVTYYRAEYQRNIARVESPQGRYMKAKRQSTVEPVFGTLTQFMGLRKVNTIGLKQANKCMQLAAIAYNIKKYLKFIEKRTKSGAGILGLFFRPKTALIEAFKAYITYANFLSVTNGPK